MTAPLVIAVCVVCLFSGFALGYAFGLVADVRRPHSMSRHPRCSCGAEVPAGTWHTCGGARRVDPR